MHALGPLCRQVMGLNGDRVIAATLEDALAEREIVRGQLGDGL